MAYQKKGYNPNSLANLNRGSNLPKLATTDPKSQELTNILLDEEVEYNGAMVTMREAILREQLKRALEGELRSCQFLIELAGFKEQPATADKPKKLTPLEELYAKMRPYQVDDRRVEKNSQKSGQNMSQKICTTQ